MVETDAREASVREGEKPKEGINRVPSVRPSGARVGRQQKSVTERNPEMSERTADARAHCSESLLQKQQRSRRWSLSHRPSRGGVAKVGGDGDTRPQDPANTDIGRILAAGPSIHKVREYIEGGDRPKLPGASEKHGFTASGKRRTRHRRAIGHGAFRVCSRLAVAPRRNGRSI